MYFLLAIIATLTIESPSDLVGLLWYAYYSVRYSKVASKLFP